MLIQNNNQIKTQPAFITTNQSVNVDSLDSILMSIIPEEKLVTNGIAENPIDIPKKARIEEAKRCLSLLRNSVARLGVSTNNPIFHDVDAIVELTYKLTDAVIKTTDDNGNELYNLSIPKLKETLEEFRALARSAGLPTLAAQLVEWELSKGAGWLAGRLSLSGINNATNTQFMSSALNTLLPDAFNDIAIIQNPDIGKETKLAAYQRIDQYRFQLYTPPISGAVTHEGLFLGGLANYILIVFGGNYGLWDDD